MGWLNTVLNYSTGGRETSDIRYPNINNKTNVVNYTINAALNNGRWSLFRSVLLISVWMVLWVTVYLTTQPGYVAATNIQSIISGAVPGKSDTATSSHRAASTLHNHTTQWSSSALLHRVGPLPWASGEFALDTGFSGFIPVRSLVSEVPIPHPAAAGNRSANIFYWFFPAQEPLEETPPLIIWLQGGPGSSSMIGLFYEMGPVHLNEKLELYPNPNSWNKHYSMIFVDNPVGSGFSFVNNAGLFNGSQEQTQARPEPAYTASDILETEAYLAANLNNSSECRNGPQSFGQQSAQHSPPPLFKNGYTANQEAVAQDLLTFLDEFYILYPSQRAAKLYITGQSYAGKYIPHFALHIHNVNVERKGLSTYIPLAGIAMGNGLTDPITQINYHAPLALALGLTSRAQASQIQHIATLAIELLCMGEWRKSKMMRDAMFSYFRNVTGSINWYDIRKREVQNDWSLMERFLQLPATKQSLNVGSAWFGKDPMVAENLKEDGMKSAASTIAFLVDNGYRTVVYQGQFDFRDGPMGSSEWIESLEWHGTKGFLAAPRDIWRTSITLNDSTPHVAGYITKHQSLVRVELLGAGHVAPMDQGFVVKQMVDNLLIGEMHD
ncbi:hypothetical protein BASA50_004205 [Batrachochytrium salamandrivorans]|uniref:Carboxypeptidase n=1 Tax=Batrachochytrium salamandrivorans TaxID=1357716 RepID=A0ABQ8FGD2_9FUNG|nr:hypothetical protein BASA62_009395 [Batrachochytrium salamandrivorans]KAH6568650.1 hypothetical protein BASA60_008606 [Batrachochytrium salamandrivorans]KAH6597862.1 hypothetical protein BASA50_004205 [Batrachochytrium salamandrivorans]